MPEQHSCENPTDRGWLRGVDGASTGRGPIAAEQEFRSQDCAVASWGIVKPADAPQQAAPRLAGCTQSQFQRWGLPASRLPARSGDGTSSPAAADPPLGLLPFTEGRQQG